MAAGGAAGATGDGAGTGDELRDWLAQMKAQDEQPRAVEIGQRRATSNMLEPQGIVIARPDGLVFQRVRGDHDGAQLAAVQRLVESVLGGVDPAQWRSHQWLECGLGGPGPIVGTHGFLRELLRTCNNGYVYCRPLDDAAVDVGADVE